MTSFADSSALVKLYADEVDHAVVRQEPFFVVSALARVEVPAALWRKVRTGGLAAELARALVADFEVDFAGSEEERPRMFAVSVTPEVLELAARSTAVHGLRAYDAVQLASALTARAADPTCDRLAAFDRGLRTAAAAEGFVLLPS